MGPKSFVLTAPAMRILAIGLDIVFLPSRKAIELVLLPNRPRAPFELLSNRTLVIDPPPTFRRWGSIR